MSYAVTKVVTDIWGSPEAKGWLMDIGRFVGKPHKRFFCPNCGEFWCDGPDVNYSMCGRPGCIENNVRLVIVRRKK